MDERFFLPSENYTKRSNSMVFGFEKIMNFAMDINSNTSVVKLHHKFMLASYMKQIAKFLALFIL